MLRLVLETLLVTCHADNLKIYMIHFQVTGRPMRVLTTVTVMNTEVEAISSWAFEHGLKLNKNRTQTVVLGHPKFLKKCGTLQSPIDSF